MNYEESKRMFYYNGKLIVSPRAGQYKPFSAPILWKPEKIALMTNISVENISGAFCDCL